jgi:hypothetical protein
VGEYNKFTGKCQTKGLYFAKIWEIK